MAPSSCHHSVHRILPVCSTLWHIHNVGCCTFLRTMKVEHGAGGQQGAEASRGSGCPSDIEDELQSCLYHRWLISASDFPFQRPGTVTMSHHYSHLRVVVCVFVGVCGRLVCDMQQVNVSMFVWCLGLCMST